MNQTEFENRWVYDPSCVFYLPLSQMDGASLVDRSGYGTPTSVYGAYRDGTNGWSFDGVDDYLWVPNADMTHLELTGNMTVAVRGEFNAGAANQAIIQTGWWEGGFLLRLETDETLQFTTFTGAGSSTTSETAAAAIVGTEIATFIASVNPSGFISKDGVDVTLTSGTHVQGTTARDLTIGNYNKGATVMPLNGHLKCLIIYNRPFGAVEHAEIAHEMTEVFP